MRVSELLSDLFRAADIPSLTLKAQHCLTVWTTESWVSALLFLWSSSVETIRDLRLAESLAD